MPNVNDQNIEDKAVRDLPLIMTFSNDLVSLSEAMPQPIKFEENDYLAAMALLSLGHQLHLFQSLLILTENHLAVPAGLIARSMMEGMALLSWCGRSPEIRPLEWRTFALVHDFRLMKKHEALGRRIDPLRKQGINASLEQYGESMLTKKAKQMRAKSEDLPDDPYVTRWPGLTIRAMFSEAEQSEIYEELYMPLSELTHWSITAIAPQTTRTGSALEYSARSSASQEALVLTSGFRSLLYNLQLVQAHLRLEGLQHTENLKDRYITSLQPPSN